MNRLDPDAVIREQLAIMAASPKSSANYTVFKNRGVEPTEEFHRVNGLPRRVWTEVDGRALAERLSATLRQPGSNATLKPTQAIALWEMAQVHGAFCPIRVGGGKTLITFLAPWFLGAKRPLLLVPAKLAGKKTDRERAAYSQMFKLPTGLLVVSFEKMSRDGAKSLLADYKPDAIIADEGHRMKNHKAAVTRRVMRYMSEHPETRVVILSGTVTKRSLHDYSHLLAWCLDSPPIPTRWKDVEVWANALDEKVNPTSRIAPGALLRFCNAEELASDDKLQAARRGFRRRLQETPGVITTEETDIDASLNISDITLDLPRACADILASFRKTWTRPDGWEVSSGPAAREFVRQITRGFYLRWDPLPPVEWNEARKRWASEVREFLKHSGRFDIDTELQVAKAVIDGKARGPVTDAYYEWTAVRDTFRPNIVVEWVSDFALEACANWAKHNDGIIWVEHPAFGERLDSRFGVPYFGQQGLRATDRTYIEDARGPIAASIGANAEGRNLQHYSKNLVAEPPANGVVWEQLLGRTHRYGQTSDSVDVDVLINSIEDYAGLVRSKEDAIYQQDTMGYPQKLLVATWDVDDCTQRRGTAWEK